MGICMQSGLQLIPRCRMVALAFMLALTGGCSKSSPSPTGIATWDEARSLAEAFALRGDARAVRDHLNLSGVPPEQLELLKTVIDHPPAIPANLKHAGTQVMTFPECEAQEREDDKNLPEDMRNALHSAIQWNVTPEKMIVFTFTNAFDATAKVRRSVGAYQTNGLWFFAASYMR